MLLCDFHIHTQMSDGHHSIREIVDAYGQEGFRAIAITDHLCEDKTFLGKAAHFLNRSIRKDNFDDYLETIRAEAERAMKLYHMTVIPGVEITKNSFQHADSAHILALGIDRYVDPNQDIVDVLHAIRNQGAISIAAHPVSTKKWEAQTYHLWNHRFELGPLFDAWEVASGPVLFEEVSGSGLPMIASSDLHHLSQMRAWKTLVQSENTTEAILESIKKQKLDFIFHQGASHRNRNRNRHRTAPQTAFC
jgi:hypothetical protein